MGFVEDILEIENEREQVVGELKTILIRQRSAGGPEDPKLIEEINKLQMLYNERISNLDLSLDGVYWYRQRILGDLNVGAGWDKIEFWKDGGSFDNRGKCISYGERVSRKAALGWIDKNSV